MLILCPLPRPRTVPQPGVLAPLPSPALQKTRFELCAESLPAAIAADRAGASRIELCSQLPIGGVTPPETLVAQVLAQVSIPVHILIRPRGGNFLYSVPEFQQMRRDIAWVRSSGAAGVALGVLNPDGSVDVPRTAELASFARPLHVTFHRAFDETPNPAQSLEDVIATGADTLLTSGLAPCVHTGADTLAALVRQAHNRIAIMAGGGLKLESLSELLARTGVPWVHGSLTRYASLDTSLAAAIRQAISLLNSPPTPE